MRKLCSKCRIYKSGIYYHKDKTSKDGLYRWCKDCKKEYDIKYRKTDKVINHERSYERKARKIKTLNDNYMRYRLNGLRHRAIKNGLEFNITVDDLNQVTHCPLLGVKLIYEGGRGYGNKYAASVDRIDNKKGYIKDNVWIMSRLANTMKHNASVDELVLFAENIIKEFKKE